VVGRRVMDNAHCCGSSDYGCTSNAPTSHKQNSDPQSDLKAAVLESGWRSPTEHAPTEAGTCRVRRCVVVLVQLQQTSGDPAGIIG
jgi:hypothetical protein